jgi:hypothetical protein
MKDDTLALCFAAPAPSGASSVYGSRRTPPLPCCWAMSTTCQPPPSSKAPPFCQTRLVRYCIGCRLVSQPCGFRKVQKVASKRTLKGIVEKKTLSYLTTGLFGARSVYRLRITDPPRCYSANVPKTEQTRQQKIRNAKCRKSGNSGGHRDGPQ